MLSVCLGLLRKAWSEAFFENCWRKLVVCRFCASDAAAGADRLLSLAANEILDGSDPSVFLSVLTKSFVAGAGGGGVTAASASLLSVSAALGWSADCPALVLLSATPSPDRVAAAAAPWSNTFSGAAASFAGAI